MQRREEDSDKPNNVTKEDESAPESQNIFTRFYKAVTGQTDPVDAKPEIFDEAYEAESAFEEVSFEELSRNFATSETRLKAYLSRKSFSMAAELKQFWKPDNSTGACYECNETFTRIRRGHHCGICGEIFCSKCCDRTVSGKLFAFSGEIRSCEFCCKVLVCIIFSDCLDIYQHISIQELKRELQLDNFDHSQFHKKFTFPSEDSPPGTGNLEENHVAQISNAEMLSTDDKHQEKFEQQLIYNEIGALQELRRLMVYGPIPVPLDTHWHHMRSVSNCFTGEILIDWLMETSIATLRDYALTIAQILLETGLIKAASFDDFVFTSDYSIYFICPLPNVEEPNRPIPFEQPNWDMAVRRNLSDTSTSTVVFRGHNESGTENDSSTSSDIITREICMKRNNKGKDTYDNWTKNIAKWCPSYYLNSTPEKKDRIPRGQRSESMDSDDSSSTETALLEVKISVLDDIPHDLVQFESEEQSNIFRSDVRTIWENYEGRLLSQLIEHANISEEWIAIIRNLSHVVCKMVKLDVRKGPDQMDIRRFVKFKKVLVEGDRQAEVINGVVCTKNVLKNGMKTHIYNPQILLIKNSIQLPNSGERYMNMETVKEQENLYLKNVSEKIIALKPNIVMVGNQISYKALSQLMEAGITVIANIKESVMEKVARSTEAQIITSIDSQLHHPVLGTCQSFYLNTYGDSTYCKEKVLMFFDNCTANLDCTVILKGHNYDELQHAKRVAYMMLLAVHNFIRETAFMREISASLEPLVRSCSPRKESSEYSAMDSSLDISVLSDMDTSQELISIPDVMGDEFNSSPQATIEKSKTVPFCDPLQCYMEAGDKLHPANDICSNEYNFASALSKAVLSISPYYTFDVPYLESVNGKKSRLIKYFTPKPYASYLFDSLKPKKISRKPSPLPVSHIKCNPKPLHPLVTTNVTKSEEHDEISSLLADFRARGGPIELVYSDGKGAELANQRSCEKKSEKKPDFRTPLLTNDKEIDALHPFNHQSLSLLYCSFSTDFEETSKFCVDPCFLQIDFFARNDITLGKFLEQYCFSTEYACPRTSCSASARSHVRKFSHASGCVEILIRQTEPNSSDDDFIYMWSWCKTCNRAMEYDRQPMSTEAYNFSFAKYLELRFYQDKISRRGTRRCPHSIHQANFHYFMKKKTVAILKYNSVDLRELVIPPTKLNYTLCPVKYGYLAEQFKTLTNQAGVVFTTGFEKQQKLADIAGTYLEPNIKSLIANQVQDRLLYKEKQTRIQMLFGDEIFSKSETECNCTEDYAKKLYVIWDEIINVRILLMKVVNDWNFKIQEFMQIKKKEEKNKHPIISSRPSSENSVIPVSEEVNTLTPTTLIDQKHQSPLHSKAETKTTESKDGDNESSVIDIGRLTVEAEAFKSYQTNAVELIRQLLPPTDSSFSSPTLPRIYSPQASAVLKLLLANNPGGYFDSNCNEKDVGGGLDGSDVGYAVVNKRSSLTLEDITEGHSQDCIRAASTPLASRSLGPIDGPQIPIDVVDSPERKSGVKQLLSGFWNSPLNSLIGSPFSSHEHYGVLPHTKIPVSILDEEPSSIIAHCLASKNYEIELNSLQRKLRNSKISLDPFDSMAEVGDTPALVTETVTPHIEMHFMDQTTDFYIKIMFADHFRKLRNIVFPHGEEMYVRSLAHCIPWEAKGGKSGSAFCKTTDDRFVLKGLSKPEVLSFMQFGPYYIQYIIQCQKEQQPTVLAKILGVYYIVYKNNATGKSSKMTFLVMENLFYRRKISHKFDLKGSVRNRMVSISTNPESEIVLMDQNLVKMSCSSPLFLREHSKEVLTRAVESDTDFLCKQTVMDYSLLVGVDEENNELVVGIIDFIRGFTFDKKLESLIKQSINPKQTPTVVPPETYRARFCKAMNQYFLCMPDRWFQFGTNFQSERM